MGRQLLSLLTHMAVSGEMCNGRGVRGLGRRSRELMTLCQRGNSTTMATSPPLPPPPGHFPLSPVFGGPMGPVLPVPTLQLQTLAFCCWRKCGQSCSCRNCLGRQSCMVTSQCNTALTQRNLLIGSSTSWLEFLHVLEYGSAASPTQHSFPKGLSCSQLRLPRS